MKKNIYVCMSESFTVYQKLTQRCRSTIPQFKKKFLMQNE